MDAPQVPEAAGSAIRTEMETPLAAPQVPEATAAEHIEMDEATGSASSVAANVHVTSSQVRHLQQLQRGQTPLEASKWQPQDAAESLVTQAREDARLVQNRCGHTDGGENNEKCTASYYWTLAKAAAENPTAAKIQALLCHSDQLMKEENNELAAVCGNLRKAWEATEGNHLAGVLDAAWDDKLPGPLLGYLRHVAQHGVDAKYRGPDLCCTAKPHASAAGIQQLAWANALEDAAKGRVLLLSCTNPGARSVIPSPQGAVEKQNPDRTMSGDFRFINDLRMVNAHCWKSDSPPAKQCSHKQLARLVAWWKARLPNVRILMSKKDVSAAFKLIWLKDTACRVMAVQLLGGHWGLEADVYAIYLVLTFGWIGSPGQWQPWGWAVKWHHEAHIPPDPHWHDEVAFSSRFLMDDGVLVEPDVGYRAELSEQVYIQGMRGILGRDALNAKKDKLEGQFDEKCLAWGLQYDSQAGTVSVPPAKLLKGAWVVHSQVFDPGNKRVALLEVQKLHGVLNYYAMVQPALRAELGSIAALLKQNSPGLWCEPPGTAEEVSQTWQEFWDSIELVRVLTARPETWEVTFTNGLTQLLDPHERVEIPGESAKVVWLGGDATPTRGAAIDWTNKLYAHYPVQEALSQLAEAAGDPSEEAMIALAELQVVICLAAVQGDKWAGKLVLNVTDNMNVRQWINHRRAKNRLARHLLRLLAYTEVKHRFVMTSTYIRTYNNKLADALTRVPPEEVQSLAATHELEYCDIEAPWASLIQRSYQGRIHALAMGDKEDLAVAEQLKLKRGNPSSGGNQSSPWSHWRVRDLTYSTATTSTYAVAAGRLGVPLAEGPDESQALYLICASVAPDTDERSWRAVQGELLKWPDSPVLIDIPPSMLADQVLEWLSGQGRRVCAEEALCTELGDVVAQKKMFVLAARREIIDENWLQRPLESHPQVLPMSVYLVSAGRLPEQAWVPASEKVQLEPRASSGRSHALPHLIGHWKCAATGRKHKLYDAQGATPTLNLKRGHGHETAGPRGAGVWIYDRKGKGSGVRELLPIEVYRMHGGQDSQWEHGLTNDTRAWAVAMAQTRSLPPRSAEIALESALEELASRPEENRSGGPKDPEEQSMWLEMTRWLKGRLWDLSQTALQKEARDIDAHQKCGGPSEVRLHTSHLEEILGRQQAEALRQAYEEANESLSRRAGKQPEMGGYKYQESLEAYRDRLLLSSLAKGTGANYSKGWHQWL
eukprot:6307466-Amphidinium_carterae.1